MKYREIVEKILYGRIIRGLIFTSRLGRRSMMGYADSGLNFDYIYKNSAVGYTRFGKIVDRILLNLPAAKAVRERKNLILSLLKKEVEKNSKDGKKSRIVDLASGPARYVLELIDDSNNKDWVEALCFDIDRNSIQQGTRLSMNRPILYKKANVFRLGHYKRLSQKVKWRPNIIVVSGLYQYTEDSYVKSSLMEIFKELDLGGILITDVLCFNKNQKLVQRLGKRKDGSSWDFYYRDPEKFINWMRLCGFDEFNVIQDSWKMHAVCVGRKPSKRERYD